MQAPRAATRREAWAPPAVASQRFGLRGREDEQVGTFTKGMRQKLAHRPHAGARPQGALPRRAHLRARPRVGPHGARRGGGAGRRGAHGRAVLAQPGRGRAAVHPGGGGEGAPARGRHRCASCAAQGRTAWRSAWRASAGAARRGPGRPAVRALRVARARGTCSGSCSLGRREIARRAGAAWPRAGRGCSRGAPGASAAARGGVPRAHRGRRRRPRGFRLRRALAVFWKDFLDLRKNRALLASHAGAARGAGARPMGVVWTYAPHTRTT